MSSQGITYLYLIGQARDVWALKPVYELSFKGWKVGK